MTFPFLRLNLQFFAGADLGGGAGNPTPQPTDTPPAGGHVPNDPPGTQQTDLPKPPEGGEQPKAPENNQLSPEEQRKFIEAEFLKSLGVEDFEKLKETLAKQKDFEESQKSEVQKAADRMKELEEQLKGKDDQTFTLQAQLAALKSGVQEESFEDVMVLAKAKVTDKVTIDEAIKQVVEKYPHFANKAQEETPKPKFAQPGSQRKSDDKDPIAMALLGKKQ